MREFKVNEFITLKMEDQLTIIYVAGERFQQCKFLLLNIPVDKQNSFDDIKSIDEASEKLNGSREASKNAFYIPPEVEFWGHCSNIQVWVENSYDTRLLHRNLAFPLLRRLTFEGDKLAKRIFSIEIAKRFSTGFIPVMIYLSEEGFLKYLSKEELKTLIEGFSPLVLLKASPKICRLALKLLVPKDDIPNRILNKMQFNYIIERIKEIPVHKRSESLYTIATNIADIKVYRTINKPFIEAIDWSSKSNLELGIKLLKFAINNFNCPEKFYKTLDNFNKAEKKIIK